MGKKNKNRYQQQPPNAPDLQQVLLASQRQPPRNPYYPDLEGESSLLPVPPPAYSDLSTVVTGPIHSNSVAMTRINSSANYPNLHQQPSVVVHSEPIPYHHRAEEQHRKMRKFNNELFLMALLAIGLSAYAFHLYQQRPCIDFLVHSPAKDINISVFDVRDSHRHITYLSIFMLFICIAKFSTGRSKSYSCYLFLVGFTTFIGTLATGYLAYLAFYSPCSTKLGELATNTVRTLVGKLVNTVPAPERGLFSESSVFDLAQEDKAGVLIFVMDLVNFSLYLSGFIAAMTLC